MYLELNNLIKMYIFFCKFVELNSILKLFDSQLKIKYF